MRGLGGAIACALLAGCVKPTPAVVPHGPGQAVTLGSLRGKVVVLNYWAVWCGPCMAEIPALVTVAAENRDRVVFLAVNSSDDSSGPAQVELWLRKNPPILLPYIFYGNMALALAFPRRVLPTTYFLDANGEVFEKVEGVLTVEQARRTIRAALERAPR